jgi:hypothetical protein
MFEDLDFSNLKLPIEPKNIIYLYLAYKLINNLDKLDLCNLTKKASVPGFSNLPPMRGSVSNNFVFLVILIIGASFMFLNNILSKISVSSISVEKIPILNKCESRKPNFLKKGCPMKKCPIFGNYDLDSWKTQCPMSQCPAFQKKKCQKEDCQTQTDESNSRDTVTPQDVEEASHKTVSGGDFS